MAKTIKNWRETVLEGLAAVPTTLKTERDGEALSDAVVALQEAPSGKDFKAVARAASAELVRVVDGTLGTRGAKEHAVNLLFALKLLAYTGTRESVEMILRAVKAKLDPESYVWTMVLGPFGEGHAGAAEVFAALSKPIPKGFVGICVLDAANEACREHGLKKHPFDSKEGEGRLRAMLRSRKAEEFSHAVSACAALPFLARARRTALIALARRHKDPAIRIEVAWASAAMGDKKGLAFLAEACLDPMRSMQAQTYLKELGKKKLIPKAARQRDFVAMSEACDWLAHPNEFGEPPSSMELFDTRTLYWPPTNDARRVWLFRYVYEASAHREERDEGIMMVGSETWAMFGEPTADKTPEEMYGMHCAWELECNDDPRSKKHKTAKAAWKLIELGA